MVYFIYGIGKWCLGLNARRSTLNDESVDLKIKFHYPNWVKENLRLYRGKRSTKNYFGSSDGPSRFNFLGGEILPLPPS